MNYVAGISAFYHDAACCVLGDGKLIAAAQEERFTRIKHDPSLPFHAFMYCLEEAGIGVNDIAGLVYYEDPDKKQSRQLMQTSDRAGQERILRETNRPAVEKLIRSGLGYEGPVQFVDHHLSHAASAFYFSGFSQSAILTTDGVGEWATTTFATACNNSIDIWKQIDFPHSLGLLYSTITHYLGFEVNEGEYKVMGLAPYGNPRFMAEMNKLVTPDNTGGYRLDLSYFDFLQANRMFSDKMISLLGFPPRRKGTAIEQHHKDLARSLQLRLEEILLMMVEYIHRTTNLKNLCMAGGVALNCVANGRIMRESSMEKVFVQPASNDAGGALGAAAVHYFTNSDTKAIMHPMTEAYLGPSYSAYEIEQVLIASGVVYEDYSNDQQSMYNWLATELDEGKIAGWFQGRMEFGPRALGARSILADPRNAGMKDSINARIKKREAFRPFAPVVPEHLAAMHFDLQETSPFMLSTCQVKSDLSLPAITHVDGSARVQTVNQETNPVLFALLMSFYERTGCPVLVNTSFNVKNEPIVCSPADAIACFVYANLDILVMDHFVVQRSCNAFGLLELVLRDYYSAHHSPEYNVYTFI